MVIGFSPRRAGLAVLAAFACSSVLAQTTPSLSVFGPATVGANPTAIAVDPAAKKVYVTNHDDNTVTVLSTDNAAPTFIATVPVGSRPNHVAVNTETDAVFVSNESDGTLSVIDARTNQVRATSSMQVGGAIALNAATNRSFILRDSTSDEFNVILGDTFQQADAIRSYHPVTLALNPVTNRLFVGTAGTSDVVPFDMNTESDYPTRECPDGSGGLVPDSGASNPSPPPCIDVPGYPVSVAVNPVTNRTYALTSTGQVAVIQGPNMTWSTFSLSGDYAGIEPLAIAVNPVTNVIYVLFANKIVQVNGTNNQPFLSQDFAVRAVGLAVDVRREIVYVATQDGPLYWTAGDLVSGGIQSGSVAIPGGSVALDIDALTGIVYVVGASGVTSVVPNNFPARVSSPITLSIRPLPNDSGAQGSSITIDAASSMSPAPLDQVRAVFYRYISIAGSVTPFRKATRNPDGTWSASLAGLPGGSTSIEAFATNGLEMDSINTDKVGVPLASAPAAYRFNVAGAVTVTAPLIKTIRRFDMNGDGRSDLVWRNAGTHQTAGWLMNGTQIQAGIVLPQPNNLPNADIVDVADFNGDGKGDLLWFEGNNGWFITTMNGLTETSNDFALAVIGAQYVTYGDFNGDGKMDLLTFHGSVESNSGYAVRLSGVSPASSGQGLIVPGLTDGKPVLVADLDGDGRDDILFLNSDGSMVFCGMVNYDCATTRMVTNAGNTEVPVVAGDFNGDGAIDLVMQGTDGRTRLWLMAKAPNGGSTLLTETLLPPGSTWRAVAAPDMNGDGKADLVWRNNDGAYAGWLMNGTQATAYQTFFGGGLGWELTRATDLDGDAKVDLIWRQADGRYGPWLMNGLNPKAFATFFGPGTGWEIRP